LIIENIYECKWTNQVVSILSYEDWFYLRNVDKSPLEKVRKDKKKKGHIIMAHQHQSGWGQREA
jgi:hypothetical protein